MPKCRPAPLVLLSAVLLCFAALPLVVGCSPPADDGPGETAADGSDEKAARSEEFVLGNLLEPFAPPPLAELDAKAGWIDQPVLDSMELLREYQKKLGKPLVTVQEALKLKNDSPENNKKILSAMGRLPANDDEVDWDASMHRHTTADIKSTNPLMISSTAEFDVTGLTSFGLFGANWELKPHAAKDTVKSWQVSKDRMMDKVVIRDDLVWSDGRPITAHDVVFSFKVIMSDQVPVPAVRSGTDKLRWVEAYNDHTLVYFHKESLATNIWNLNFPVIPKHIYEKSIREDPTLQDSKYHVELENNPVVGGPYVISKRIRGQEIVLNRREDYYMHDGRQVRDKAFFKEVRFRIIPDPTVSLLALKKGEIDEMVLRPEQWETQTDDADFYRLNTKAFGLEWLYFYFGWNNETAFFSDVRVRKAMSHAFNYEEMLDKLLYGLYEPCNGVFHNTSPWAPVDRVPELYKQNLDKAEELLDEAGWTDSDGDGIRDKMIDGRRVKFEFRILCFNIPLRIAICNLLRENLDQIGVLCEVRPMEFTVLQEKTRKHEFHAMFAGWGTGADPDMGDNIWGTGQMRNFCSYSNPKVDELYKKGRGQFDPEKRARIYGEIHKLLYEDQPYTWLYFRSSFYGFNKDLRGYMFSPRGPYNYGPGFGSIWKPKSK